MYNLIGSGNGVLPGGTMLLPEPVLTYHPVFVTWGPFTNTG